MENTTTEKRTNYLEWDEYFIAMALLEVKRSSDKRIKNAALILNSRQIIIGIAPETITENDHYKNHAEFQALKKIEKGHTLYSTKFPCPECAKCIVNKNIKEIIYLGGSPTEETTTIFLKNNIRFRRFISNKRKIVLDFNQFHDDLPLTP